MSQPVPHAIRVLVVDDDPLARETLAEYIAASDGLDFAGACADGAAAVEAVRADPPDVVLMDVRMPGMDGPSATREVVALAPGVRVLAMTTFDDDDAIARTFDAGGRGFLLKAIRPDALAAAIRAAHSGVVVVPQDAMRRWSDARVKPVAPPLTDRERQVLTALGRGHTNREIAKDMFTSTSTVKALVASLMRKLDAPTRTAVVAKAHHLGLLASPRPGSAP